MTTPYVLTSHLAATFLVLAATGLLLRGRASYCWSFFAYVCATSASDIVTAAWPERLFVYPFYSMKETTLSLLKILACLEIWRRTFSAFPRARVHVGLLVAGGLLAIAAAVLSIPPRPGVYEALIILGARLQAGALLLYAIVVSAAAWYRVPLHPVHRAILLGFAVYLTLQTLLLTLMASDTSSTWAYEVCRPVNSVAYCAVSAWWAWAAWRPLRAPSALISRLQPWAHSW